MKSCLCTFVVLFTAAVAAASNAHLDSLARLAASNDKAARLDSLIEQGAEPHARDEHGRTLLMYAAGAGAVNAARALVETHDLPVNDSDSHHTNVMCWACYGGNLDLVRYLHRKGAHYRAHGCIPAGTDGSYYGSPLNCVAGRWGSRRFDLMQFLIDTCGAEVDEREYSRQTHKTDAWTPLFWAANHNDTAAVRFLLDHAAEVDIVCEYEEVATPLIAAAAAGHLPTTRQLLAAGADPDLTGQQSAAPLLQAIYGENHELTSLLLAHRADPNVEFRNGYSAFAAAIVLDDSAAIDTLLAHGAAVNDTFGEDGLELTPLMLASGLFQPSVVQKLLERKADPRVLSVRKQSALAFAVAGPRLLPLVSGFFQGYSVETPSVDRAGLIERRRETIELLLDAGSDPYLGGVIEFGFGAQRSLPPLLYAVHKGDSETVKAMLAHGFPVDTVVQGTSPLAAAIASESVAMVSTIIDAGARVDSTAFEELVRRTQSFDTSGIVCRLLERLVQSASTEFVDNDSVASAAVLIAARMSCLDPLRRLVETGAPLHMNIDGLSVPLWVFALDGVRPDGITYLLERDSMPPPVQALEEVLPRAATYATPAVLETVIERIHDTLFTDRLLASCLLAAAEKSTPTLKWLLRAHRRRINRDMLRGAFASAAGNGHDENLRVLMRKGMRKDTEALSQALGSALMSKDTAMTNKLLALGGEINAAACHGLSCLEAAVAYEDTALVAFLLSHGCDPSQESHRGVVAHLTEQICERSYVSRIDTMLLSALLRHGASPDERADNGTPAIVMCVDNREGAELASILLAHGVNIDARGPDSATALTRALKKTHCELVDTLLAHGANPNLADSAGMTPLLYAVTTYRCSHAAGALLDAGADPAVRDTTGATVLYHACETTDGPTVAKILALRGEDINVANAEGFTPLHAAAVKSDASALTVLLEAGARVDAVDSAGRTPLWYAADYGRAACAKELLEAGASVENSARNGFSALHRAAGGGKLELVRMLLDAGTHPDVRAADSSTPLMHAVAEGDTDCVVLLLRAGADPDAADRNGSTALHGTYLGRKRNAMLRLLETPPDELARVPFTGTWDLEGGWRLERAIRFFDTTSNVPTDTVFYTDSTSPQFVWFADDNVSMCRRSFEVRCGRLNYTRLDSMLILGWRSPDTLVFSLDNSRIEWKTDHYTEENGRPKQRIHVRERYVFTGTDYPRAWHPDVE